MVGLVDDYNPVIDGEIAYDFESNLQPCMIYQTF